MTDRLPQFNRISFITLNSNRLFTAEQVCDIVEYYCEREWENIPAVDYERANEFRKRIGMMPIQKQSCRFQEILDYGKYIIVICRRFEQGYSCEHQRNCVNDEYVKFCGYSLGNSLIQPGTYPIKELRQGD